MNAKQFEVDSQEADTICAQFLASDQFRMLNIAPTQLPNGEFCVPGLNIKTPSSEKSVISFSGPNQEKLETAFALFLDSMNV